MIGECRITARFPAGAIFWPLEGAGKWACRARSASNIEPLELHPDVGRPSGRWTLWPEIQPLAKWPTGCTMPPVGVLGSHSIRNGSREPPQSKDANEAKYKDGFDQRIELIP